MSYANVHYYTKHLQLVINNRKRILIFQAIVLKRSKFLTDLVIADFSFQNKMPTDLIYRAEMVLLYHFLLLVFSSVTEVSIRNYVLLLRYCA